MEEEDMEFDQILDKIGLDMTSRNLLLAFSTFAAILAAYITRAVMASRRKAKDLQEKHTLAQSVLSGISQIVTESIDKLLAVSSGQQDLDEEDSEGNEQEDTIQNLIRYTPKHEQPSIQLGDHKIKLRGIILETDAEDEETRLGIIELAKQYGVTGLIQELVSSVLAKEAKPRTTNQPKQAVTKAKGGTDLYMNLYYATVHLNPIIGNARFYDVSMNKYKDVQVLVSNPAIPIASFYFKPEDRECGDNIILAQVRPDMEITEDLQQQIRTMFPAVAELVDIKLGTDEYHTKVETFEVGDLPTWSFTE